MCLIFKNSLFEKRGRKVFRPNKSARVFEGDREWGKLYWDVGFVAPQVAAAAWVATGMDRMEEDRQHFCGSCDGSFSVARSERREIPREGEGKAVDTD